MHKRFLLVGTATALFAGTSAMAGPLGLVDNFSDTDLPEYNLTKVLDQGSADNIVFASPGGVLEATSVGADGAEQVLFLRNDGYSLDVGEVLVVDGPTTESEDGTNDLGIVIGATPTAGTRSNFLFISYRSPTQLNSRGFIGTSEIAQDQAFGVTAEQLFIARPDANTIELGYFGDGARTVVSTRDITGNTSIADNIGFYADLRADGATISGLDNLTLAVIPEPTSLAALGGLGLLAMRRRKA